MVIGEPDSPEQNRTYEPGELLTSLRKYTKYRVRCPYSTVVTRNAEIEPRCNRSEGYFMDLYGRYEDIVAFDFVPETLYGEKLRIVFDGLTVLPMNFVDPPQMFIGIWKKSKLALRMVVAGVVTTMIGIVGIIVIVVLFFTCDPWI